MWHRENFIGMSFYFVDVNRELLLMRKLWRITHKLSIAQKGFMSSFLMMRQSTHRWSPQKQFIAYNPNFVTEMVCFLHNTELFQSLRKESSSEILAQICSPPLDPRCRPLVNEMSPHIYTTYVSGILGLGGEQGYRQRRQHTTENFNIRWQIPVSKYTEAPTVQTNNIKWLVVGVLEQLLYLALSVF